MTNAHKGRTGDLRTDAIEAAGGLFTKYAGRYRRLIDWEDEKQEFILHVLKHLHTYNPSKGTISTWVGVAFRTYWTRATQSRMERQGYEFRFDSTPGAMGASASIGKVIDSLAPESAPVHDSSPLIEELLNMVQERRREALFDVLALGTTTTAAAERHGVSTSAVQKWVKDAKDLWREHYGVTIERPRVAKRTDTHCVEGHEFTPENTRFDGKGKRRCGKCSSIKRRRHEEARRADILRMYAA